MLAGLPLQVSELDGETVLIAPKVRALRYLRALQPPHLPNRAQQKTLPSQQQQRSPAHYQRHHEPAIGSAQISIDNTTLGALSREDGRYTITGVPDGEYTIRVRRLASALSRRGSHRRRICRCRLRLMPVSVALDESSSQVRQARHAGVRSATVSGQSDRMSLLSQQDDCQRVCFRDKSQASSSLPTKAR